jgi:hypothetical protein
LGAKIPSADFATSMDCSLELLASTLELALMDFFRIFQCNLNHSSFGK